MSHTCRNGRKVLHILLGIVVETHIPLNISHTYRSLSSSYTVGNADILHGIVLRLRLVFKRIARYHCCAYSNLLIPVPNESSCKQDSCPLPLSF